MQCLLEQAGSSPVLLPTWTVQSLRREWYDSTLQRTPRVAADLPRARPARAINTFYFNAAVVRDDQTLELSLSSADATSVQTLVVPAEIFTLPAGVQELALNAGGTVGRLAQVAIQLTSTGDWAWLAFTTPTAPVPLPDPRLAALGIDPNIGKQLVGWDGNVVKLARVHKAADGTLEARRRAFTQAAPQLEALLDQLHNYALIGIEGTDQNASLAAMEQDLKRSFTTLIFDRLASTCLTDPRRQLLQTYAPFTSIDCPGEGCCGKAIPAGDPETCPVSVLACPECKLVLGCISEFRGRSGKSGVTAHFHAHQWAN